MLLNKHILGIIFIKYPINVHNEEMRSM